MSLEERLMARREVAGDCWLFAGARTSNGYGSMRVDGRTEYAHRVSFRHFVGPIPDGLDLDHLCRTRACFNPAHLEPVSRQANLRRSPLTWAANASKTHCPKGHEYSQDNTYIVRARRRDGGHYESRACITCRRARHHARKAAA